MIGHQKNEKNLKRKISQVCGHWFNQWDCLIRSNKCLFQYVFRFDTSHAIPLAIPMAHVPLALTKINEPLKNATVDLFLCQFQSLLRPSKNFPAGSQNGLLKCCALHTAKILWWRNISAKHPGNLGQDCVQNC